MKTRFTILFILVCMISSLHISTFVKVEASEVNVQLVIPKDVDDSETILEIDKEVPTSKEGSKSNVNAALPKTGELRNNLAFIGTVVCIFIALFVFYQRKSPRR